jgi:hypothetical protein
MNAIRKPWDFDKIFPDPDHVGQSEYLAIYEVVEGFRDDPEMVRGILEEFRGWAEDLLGKSADWSREKPSRTSPLTDGAIRQLAESVVDNMGDVFYDPTEFNDPWDQEGPQGIEGATGRLIERVTQDIEAGIREALRLYRESSHVVVLVTPFEGESGVLVNGRVVYIASADSQHTMPASQVATALASTLGVGVISLDLRLEMKALTEAERYEEATWGNVPPMVAEKLAGQS